MKPFDYGRFHWLVSLLFEQKLRKELAHRIGVSFTTVDRWAAGTVRPHPFMGKMVLDEVDRLIKGE